MNCDRNDIDPKYKFIVEKSFDERYYEMLEWVNKNSKKGVSILLVDKKDTSLLLAFEDEDDALLFKIKYSGR